MGEHPAKLSATMPLMIIKKAISILHNQPVHLLCVFLRSGREEDEDSKKKRLEGRRGETKTPGGLCLPQGMSACRADRTSLS